MRLSINTDKYLCDIKSILVKIIKNMTDIKPTESISGDFIAQMIPHHQGAIQMSENALKFNICPELKPILEAIIASQKQGAKKNETPAG